MRDDFGGSVGTWVLRVAAVLAVPLAIVLVALAIDVLRTPGAVSGDDGRFATAPLRAGGLWEPRVATSRLLGLDDDLEYRRLMALYLRVEPGRVEFQGFPELEAARAKASFELTRRTAEEPDPTRRSRILTLFGVMTLDKRLVTDEERTVMLRTAVEAFRAAIELDPSNDDAKTNLETVLRVFGPVALVGAGPSGGRNQGNVSGQGTSGSGY